MPIEWTQTMEEPLKTSWTAANAGTDGKTGRLSYGGLNLDLPWRSVYEFRGISSASIGNAFQNLTSVPPPTRQESIGPRKNPLSNRKSFQKAKDFTRRLVLTETMVSISGYFANHTNKHWHF